MNELSDINELVIDVTLEMEAPPKEVVAVEEVLREEGIRGKVRATYMRLSMGELPWAIILLAPLFWFISAFFVGAGQEAGRDAWKGLRKLVSRLYAARRNKHGRITIRTTDTHTIIALQDDLPDEAYKRLVQMSPDRLNGGNWIWDFKQKRWVNQNEWMRRREG